MQKVKWCAILDYRGIDSRELSYSRTIKLEGLLGGYPILLLIDSWCEP